MKRNISAQMINLAPSREDWKGDDDNVINLKRIVKAKIITEIFDHGVNEKLIAKNNQSPGSAGRSFGLFVMVVDTMGTEILNSCMRMHELGQRRVALIENLEVRRKPLQNLEAIYVIMPCEDSVLHLIDDFRSPHHTLYKCAHVYFTRRLRPNLFDAIAASPVASYIRTLKELNLAFYPKESQVFDCNMKRNFYDIYSPVANPLRQQEAIDIMSDKILSLFQTIGNYPKIHYQGSAMAFNVAQLTNKKLETAYLEGQLGNGIPGDSIMIVVERSVDTVTPLLHSMALEAFVNDILPIKKGYYEYEYTNAHGDVNKRLVKLDETDDLLWDSIRHLHVADAASVLPSKFTSFLVEHHMIQKDNPTLQDMAQILKDFPQYHKEITEFSLHMGILKMCMAQLKSGLLKIIQAEQNIATGVEFPSGKPIQSLMVQLAPFFTDKDLSTTEKLRLVMLYVILKNGSPESDIDKIFEGCDISKSYKGLIINLSFLGINVLTRRRAAHNRPHVKERKVVGQYESSRWVPYIQDVAESAVDGTLGEDKFSVMPNADIERAQAGLQQIPRIGTDGLTIGGVGGVGGPVSANRRSLGRHRSAKTIVICFVGGLTFAEIHAAHNVAAATGANVLIGGDEILTPGEFMQKVDELKRWSAFEDDERTLNRGITTWSSGRESPNSYSEYNDNREQQSKRLSTDAEIQQQRRRRICSKSAARANLMEFERICPKVTLDIVGDKF